MNDPNGKYINPNGKYANPNKDDFDRMVQLAEFGAKRHDERRQVEFRVFIAYMTVLVLAFYQIDKIVELESPWPITIGLVFVHLVYLLWEIRLSRALVNDAWRRNFYLKKAECILHHLSEEPEKPFCPSEDRCVTVSFGAKKTDMSEAELFNERAPKIILVSSVLRFWKHWGQIFSDWARVFETVIPTAMIILLIFALWKKIC